MCISSGQVRGAQQVRPEKLQSGRAAAHCRYRRVAGKHLRGPDLLLVLLVLPRRRRVVLATVHNDERATRAGAQQVAAICAHRPVAAAAASTSTTTSATATGSHKGGGGAWRAKRIDSVLGNDRHPSLVLLLLHVLHRLLPDPLPLVPRRVRVLFRQVR